MGVSTVRSPLSKRFVAFNSGRTKSYLIILYVTVPEFSYLTVKHKDNYELESYPTNLDLRSSETKIHHFIIMFQSLILLSVNSYFCLISYFNLPNISFLLLVMAKPSCLSIQHFLPMMAFIHCNRTTSPFGLHLVSFGLTTKMKYISFLAVQIFF